MYKSALELRKSGDNRKNLERIIKSENLIQRNEGVRARMSGLKEQVKNNREQTVPVIFYLCSHHAHPAEDHKDYENKIYVDRYWYNTVKEVYDEGTIKKVRQYIKANNVMTVQEVMGPPVYLISRCYCRHFMIPLQTTEVLDYSLKTVRKNHPEGIMWFKPLKDSEREQRFQKKRLIVSRAINTLDSNVKTEQWSESTGYCSKLKKTKVIT